MGVGSAILWPLVKLALAAALPFGTAALLRWIYLADMPADREERARRLLPFRRAALLVGLGQLQLAWMTGVTAPGPTLVDGPGSPAALAFGALTAAITFASGGIARRVEEPPGERSTALGAALVRLRLLPFFAGPVAVAALATQLPLVDGESVRWPVAALALVLVALGAAFGGLILSVATGALLPARGPVREVAREAARGEGTALWLVLRLPTPGARLANAAAIPWARTMVVADRTAELLERDELLAVLAHEAGHLSEKPTVALARLGAATLVLYAVIVGPVLASTLPDGAALAVILSAVLLGVLGLIAAARMARRMEVRADRRAAETVGPEPLARALERLHESGQMPLVTGRRRIHPDLYDRLIALGRDPGPRPDPPRRGGTLIGLGLAVLLVGAPALAFEGTDVQAADVRELSDGAAEWRLRLDAWDAEAMMALAWHARADGDLALAAERTELARRMGPDEQGYWQLVAELDAARGDCDAARDAFQRSLEAQARRVFEAGWVEGDLELGGYRLPPTLVTECEMSVGDAFGEPGEGDLEIDWTGEL